MSSNKPRIDLAACPPPVEVMVALTCQESVHKLGLGLLLEPPERRVGYPLHDALVEDAPHLLLVPALELADENRIPPRIFVLRGAQSRAGRRGSAPHDRLFFGPRYSIVFVRNNFSLANHFGRRTMHATGRKNKTKTTASRCGGVGDGGG